MSKMSEVENEVSTKMSREEMIRWLVDNDIGVDGWFDSTEKDEWFEMILRNGFVGYENQTDEELATEIKERQNASNRYF